MQTPKSFNRVLGTTSVLAGALALAACATPTPYQPATGSGSYSPGYSDQQIEPERFQVSFAGNNLTQRETVERYLLFRAAQLTLERGYDHFVLANRDTERRTRTYVDDNFGYSQFGYWGPSWRFYNSRFGWRSFGGGYGFGGYRGFGGFGGSGFDVRTVDRYEAFAEIVLGRGNKPEDVRAFDARAVIESLGPTVRLPERR